MATTTARRRLGWGAPRRCAVQHLCADGLPKGIVLPARVLSRARADERRLPLLERLDAGTLRWRPPARARVDSWRRLFARCGINAVSGRRRTRPEGTRRRHIQLSPWR